jgi:NAD(P)-dependent dehydrogenase (short-subunit alcohol dehydrogenase family)
MNKTALVTGGNSGIGYATAELLAKNGYDVCIAGRQAEQVNRAAKKLGVDALVADITRLDDLRAIAGHFHETGLDALVNCAGIAEIVPLGHYTAEAFARHIDTNVRGPLFLIQELMPALEKRRGAITTISSIIVTHGAPAVALYAASKGAVDAFTRNLALELAPRGVRINAVAPGAIETPIFEKFGLDANQLAQLAAQQREEAPLKRRGEPGEVAQVVLAQLESSYVTGSVWNVDGGTSA